MADRKALYVDTNGDYVEVGVGTDSLQALSFDTASWSLTDALLGDVTNKMIKSDGSRAFAANQDFGGFKITGLANGTVSTDAATYGQLQAMINGLDWKQYVRAATTGALPAYTYANGSSGVGATLTATANAALPAQDGVTLVLNDRLLVKNETGGNAPYNGVYIVTQVGSVSLPYILTRTTDANSAATLLPETTVPISEGTTQADYAYTVTTPGPITIGTTNITFTQFIVSLLQAGSGINITGDIISAVIDGTLHFTAGAIGIQFSTAYNDLKAVSAQDLSSTASGKGASIIGWNDPNSVSSQTTVEGALDELYALAGAHQYIVGTGGVTKGDLVYLSGVNTVSPMPVNAAHVALGLATATVAAAGNVEVKRFDYIIPGAVSGATVDQKYYWDGTTRTTTLPATSGSYVWEIGVAVNATDLLCDVNFVKKNA